METFKEMVINREPSEEASCKKECRDIIIVAMAVVVTLVEVIITSKVILEGCNLKCRVAIMEEAEEVEGYSKVVAIIKPKATKISKGISNKKTTTIKPSNANSLKAAEIVLTVINAPLHTALRNYR